MCFGQRTLRLYGALHDEARGREGSGERPAVADRLTWPIKPKFHLFDHLVNDVIPTYGSPREYWTYRDEDFMAQVTALAEQTPNPSTLAGQILRKAHLYEALLATRPRRQPQAARGPGPPEGRAGPG
jgi:hypothetical protein